MFGNIKKIFKWSPGKDPVKSECKSQLIKALIKLLDDILLWNTKWLSLSFILFLNILFMICIHKNINFLQLFFGIATVLASIDAFEAWLKYKHRTTFLQRIAQYENVKLYQIMVQFEIWLKKRCMEYVILRETNHTKAFLLTNIALGAVYVVARSLSGYALMYILLMGISVSHLLIPHIRRAIKKMKQHAESDGEIDSLIPVASEQDLKELTFELDSAANERQSIDYWRLEDIPVGDSSDSSDNSSLVTNFSKDKLQTLDKNMDNSSESSDDEYIPTGQQEEQLQSTLEVIQSTSTWSDSAYTTFCNLTGAVSSMIYPQTTQKLQRVSSVDSSDGFEVIDKDDLT